MHQKRNRPLGTNPKRWPCCGRFAVVAVAIVLSLVWSNTYAQETGENTKESTGKKAAPRHAGVAPEKETSIRKLLELTGAKQNAVDFGQQLGSYLKSMLQKSLPAGEHTPQIGETLIGKLMAHLNSDELIVRLIPVYDYAFTQDDLKGIIAFYESASGRKLLEANPKVMEEANTISEQWIKEMIPEIMEQMVGQFPELRRPDVPAPESHSGH